MANAKENNNDALEELKEKLKKVIKQIPISETGFAIDFFTNVFEKLFVVRDNNNQKLLDIHSVISYINNRMKNTKSRQHQAFWAKIYKMLLDAKEKLEKIEPI